MPTPFCQTVWSIDDDTINNLICRKVVQQTSFAQQFLSFTNPIEALKQLAHYQETTQWNYIPDAIFLDINMPEMTGWDFLEEYKPIYQKSIEAKKILIFMLSSSTLSNDLEKAKSYAMVTDYFVKPLSEKIIQQVIQRHTSVL